jgi:hypothetical protein
MLNLGSYLGINKEDELVELEHLGVWLYGRSDTMGDSATLKW